MSKSFNAPRSDLYCFDPEDLVLIEDEGHPLYDPRVNLPLDENLVLNIMVNGVIEPVIVRKNGDTAEVVDGRQRVRAAREANKRLKAEGKEPIRVKSEVRRGEDSDLFGVLISTNEHRQDDTPLGKADKLQRFLNMGRTEDEAAIAFGVSGQCVKQWVKLLDLSAPVRKAVESGRVSASAASQLADLSTELQKEALDGLLSEAKPTARKAAKIAKKGRTDETDRPRKKAEIIEKLNDPELSQDWKDALRWVLRMRKTASNAA